MYPFGENYCDIPPYTYPRIINIEFSAPFYGANYDRINVRNLLTMKTFGLKKDKLKNLIKSDTWY